MATSLPISNRDFRQNGYAVIPGLLSPEEAAYYRRLICELSGVGDDDWKDRNFECPDGITKHRQFWPLITNPRLLSAIRALLGPTCFYTRHSDLHAHRIGGWHRDSACRVYGIGPDWDPSFGEYSVVRVAIYLQSYQESGSTLGIIPGSHLHEEPISEREGRYWKRRQAVTRYMRRTSDTEVPARVNGRWIRTRKGLPYLTVPSEAKWIATEPGDCIIFDQRLYHSASKIHGPKYAAYLSYSADNGHTQNHMRYYLKSRRDLNYGECPDELVHILKDNDIYIEPPTEELNCPGVHIPSRNEY